MNHTLTWLMLLAAAPLAVAEEAAKPAMTNALMKDVKRLVFVGDSLTDGSAWCDWVWETLKAKGHPKLMMHNAGVAGDTAAKVKARCAADVVALKPDLVVLNIGTNDILRKTPLADYRRDVDDAVRAIRAGGARVLLSTPPALRDPKLQEQQGPMADALRAIAQEQGCAFLDLHAPFVASAAGGKEPWGPGGVHHSMDGWRTMAREVLNALGCAAPMIEQTTMYPGALTEWYVGPVVPWKAGTAYPPLPELPTPFNAAEAGWAKFDREDTLKKTSWWQISWVARGGIMPCGPLAASREGGAFSLATVRVEAATRTTLHVGGSPPYAVWLNGALVFDGKDLHGYHPDADRFPVTLQAGDNRLLVFTTWLFYVSLGDL